MAYGVNHRKQLVDAARLVLAQVNGTVNEYRHALVTIEYGIRAYELVEGQNMPYAGVAVSDMTGTFEASGRSRDNLDLIVAIYIERDEQRWPGKDAEALIDELITDVEKALDSSFSLGINCTRPVSDRWRVYLRMDHEGALAFLVRTYEKSRARN